MELRRFFRGPASAFKVFLDDACGMPSNWRETWSDSKQWGLWGNQHWPTKYGAQGFIPHMVDNSPFVTANWSEAAASIVVLFARHQASGVAIGQQQCLQRLETRSPAWRATRGARHFFIFTDSRGPCCLGGQYKDVSFLGHHIIGPHAEPVGLRTFTRNGLAPPISCYDARKDVGIPTPNIHFPRTPYAGPLLARTAAAATARVRSAPSRKLLMFYAGWNYGERMALVKTYRNDSDPRVLVRSSVPSREYAANMLDARFCPVCGGYSQWTPRLAEALHYGCVPVILSVHLEPPWSELLDWSTFSLRVHPSQIRSLKQTLLRAEQENYEALHRGVLRARAALEYHLDEYTGRDMLPLLLWQMHRRLLDGPPAAPRGVRQVYNDVRTDHDYSAALAHARGRAAHVVEAHAELTVETEEGKQRWQCSTYDACMCSCVKWTDELDDVLLTAIEIEGNRSVSPLWRARRSSFEESNAWMQLMRQVRSTAGNQGRRHRLTDGIGASPNLALAIRRHAYHLLSQTGRAALPSTRLRDVSARIAAVAEEVPAADGTDRTSRRRVAGPE
ncbi:hypothetical protein EMIHUDRAFT_119255 [Emiliania huxleyi CCMP1516]|uniref:Exostosin GT47 domain-containing protein n=2 Tax=Emiliania huxleyi TaxID=2903 RepID=A0A0D3IX02_EMIH1|nr:hypothetical protein EMIHUDRAFT_119255 [Emiliania huxleyi CCMP1516]EOD15787.1 hypothetical protein EMIHUDRAFT_119255 [Emiliania huxleyi CCMP1516]|eukprot:XP_005768216.1 hypothetical protein EMIHUDRAFT_119255 [Emiliania huxleyi CCMP1516]